MKKMLWIVLAVIAAVLGFLVWSMVSFNKEGDAMQSLTKRYMEFAVKGDYTGAASLETAELQKNLTPELFELLVAPIRGAAFVKWKDAGTEYNTLSVEVRAEDGAPHTLAYQLVGGDGNYRIADVAVDSALKIFETAQNDGTAETINDAVIKEVILSDKSITLFDDYRVSAFTKDTGRINVGVLTRREKDITVSAELILTKTGEKLGPVTGSPGGFYYALGKGVSSGVSFYFTRPTKGWVPGDYKVIITSSRGDKKEAAFRVQENP